MLDRSSHSSRNLESTTFSRRQASVAGLHNNGTLPSSVCLSSPFSQPDSGRHKAISLLRLTLPENRYAQHFPQIPTLRSCAHRRFPTSKISQFNHSTHVPPHQTCPSSNPLDPSLSLPFPSSRACPSTSPSPSSTQEVCEEASWSGRETQRVW